MVLDQGLPNMDYNDQTVPDWYAQLSESRTVGIGFTIVTETVSTGTLNEAGFARYRDNSDFEAITIERVLTGTLSSSSPKARQNLRPQRGRH